MRKILIYVGRLEGISFLALLLLAMPLKYIFGYAQATRMTGMAHGLLFLAYISLLHRYAAERGWPWRERLPGYLAAVVPCGTFFFERRLRGDGSEAGELQHEI